MKYRSDIDGLRAIAVVPVVLFHAGFSLFSGGFVGVDVFFVISGYLITLIIVEQIKAGTFSLTGFYERRIRRIFPALFVMMFVVFILSYVILFPEQFKVFGRSVVASTLSFSNMIFWLESGYFDTSSLSKPLLHTWSLGVEEQFYICFPLLLILVYRYVKCHWSYVLIPLALISLVLAEYYVHHRVSTAFYWAPMRAWELFTGAFVALDVLPKVKRHWIRECLSMLGLCMIFLAVFLFTEETAFPGLSALIPCIGATLLIYTGGSGSTFASRLLSIRPLVFIGLISYSLYLWHWPLIVFSRLLWVGELSLSVSLLLVAASCLCGYLSWRYIEKPFRGTHHLLNRRNVFITAGAVMFFFSASGFYVYKSKGLSDRFSNDILTILHAKLSNNPDEAKCFGDSAHPKSIYNQCLIGNKDYEQASVFLWGDSHGNATYGTFKWLNEHYGVETVYAADASCPPLLGFATTQACMQANDDKLSFLREHKSVEYVVLVARWSAYIYGRNDDFGPAENNQGLKSFINREGQQFEILNEERRVAFARALNRSVDALLKLDKKIIIVYPIPEVGYVVPETLARLQWKGEDISNFKRPYAYYQNRHQYIIHILDSLVSKDGVFSVHPEKKICDGVNCITSDKGHSLYRDDNHLSFYGAGFIAPLFLKPLNIQE